MLKIGKETTEFLNDLGLDYKFSFFEGQEISGHDSCSYRTLLVTLEKNDESYLFELSEDTWNYGHFLVSSGVYIFDKNELEGLDSKQLFKLLVESRIGQRKNNGEIQQEMKNIEWLHLVMCLDDDN